MMIRFIDTHSGHFGVEPICTVLKDTIEGGFVTPSGGLSEKRCKPSQK